jgi:ketosteroid isomerase-like protein
MKEIAMQRHLSIGIALLIVFCSNVTTLSAQDASIEVKTVMGKWLEAKQVGDATLVGYYLSDDFVGVGPRGQVMDKRQFVAALANKEMQVAKIETGDQTVAFYGPLAVATGVHKITGKLGGEDISGNYRYVEVVKKSGDRWMVVASTLTQVKEPASVQPAAAPAR